MSEETNQNGTDPNNDAVTDDAKVTTRAVKMRVTDIEWLQEESIDDESPAATLSRLRDELLTAREQEIVLEAAVKEYGTMISQLNSDLETLRSGSSTTALTSPAGQSSFSDFSGGAIKETMDAVKDVCDDETVCIKTAVHMLDTKAAMVSKQLDRDHSADQKQLDRVDKEKDRKLKLDLAEKKAQHERDMALIKKGVVKDADLEGVTFLGSMEKRKTAGERLAEKKKHAYHAASAEEEDFCDPGDEYSGEGAEVDDEI